MRENLTNEELHLLDLFDKGYLHELTKDEQSFVLMNCSEEEFNQQHKIRDESHKLQINQVPKRLDLPNSKPANFRLIWTSLSSAAAAAILTFLIVHQEVDSVKVLEKPIYLSSDTVVLQKVDTVIQYVQGSVENVYDMVMDQPEIPLRDSFEVIEPLPQLTLWGGKHQATTLFQDRKDWPLNPIDHADVLKRDR